MTQLESFALDMRFLLGLVVFLALSFILVIVLWTGVKVWVFRARQRNERRSQRKHGQGSDGLPLPPVAAGLCDHCEHPFEEVYHLSSGRRLCRRCYEAEDEQDRLPGI